MKTHLEVLLSCEWCQEVQFDDELPTQVEQKCPNCGAFKTEGHKPDCELDYAILHIQDQISGRPGAMNVPADRAPQDNEALGLYFKFAVVRNDQNKRHKGCQYFPLDLIHDKHAVPAARAYAASVQVENLGLALDLYKKADEFEARVEAGKVKSGDRCPTCDGTGKHVEGSKCDCNGGRVR